MQKNCGYAITSMILGIIGTASIFIPGLSFIGFICSVIAIILGVIGKNTIDNSNGNLTGRGMASAGVILGIISIGLNILLLIACATIIGSMNCS